MTHVSKNFAWLLSVWLGICFTWAQGRDLDVVLVQGAEGTPDYKTKFDTQTAAWKAACAKAEVPAEMISGADTALRLEQRLAAQKPERSLWLVLIGHGTFDGRDAKFNAEGPDFNARQLSSWLAQHHQEVVVIHCTSASGGFLRPLAGKNRVIITATKGPDEVFYARFGEHFAEAISGMPEADLNEDRQISLLEAFRHASKSAAEFYESDNRLATEHALIEDNGDGIGTRRELLEADSQAPSGTQLDGERAAQLVLVLSPEEKKLTDSQRQQRDALEKELKTLKEKRQSIQEAQYYAELEKILVKLAAVYQPSS